MNPKEKAKELYNKFKEALAITDMQAGANPFVVMCCLITINQALEEINLVRDEYAEERAQYWEEVKNEIEKL